MSSAVPLQAHWTHPDGTTSWVGTLSLAGHAQIQSFTYAPTWLASGFEIGVGLPLQTGPLSPPGGMSTFGALDDAGPDSWGRRVISRSRPLEEVSTSLGMLAAVADESRQGALRLSTGAGDWLTSGQVAHVEELATVLADVEAFTRGEADTRALRHIYLGSSSQGGARPKSTLRPRKTATTFSPARRSLSAQHGMPGLPSPTSVSSGSTRPAQSSSWTDSIGVSKVVTAISQCALQQCSARTTQ